MRRDLELQPVNHSSITCSVTMDTASARPFQLSGIRLPGRVNVKSLVVGLSILALLLRVANIATRPIWLDEAFSDWSSGQSFRSLWTVLPTYEVHPPFYYSLLKVWRML